MELSGEYSCRKHMVPLVHYSDTLNCIHCLLDKMDRLRDYNRNLSIAVAEERRLRGAAQRVIGKLHIYNERLGEKVFKVHRKLILIEESADATINSLKLELENLRLGK